MMSNNFTVKTMMGAFINTRCTDSGCRLKIGRGVSNLSIINIEEYWIKLRKHGKINDYVIFCVYNSASRTSVIELKSNRIHVDSVVEKLQNGMDEITEITSDFDWCTVAVYPILCFKGINPFKLEELKKRKISTPKQFLPIIAKKNNDFLTECFV